MRSIALACLFATVATPALAAPTVKLGGSITLTEGQAAPMPIIKTGSGRAKFGVRTVPDTAPATDFVSFNKVLSPYGSTAVEVQTIQDTEFEATKRFKVQLYAVAGSKTIVDTTPQYVTILDDDIAPPPPPVICPDGTKLPAGSVCPTPLPPPPVEETWVKCIDTNFTCYIEGTAKVRYGNATLGWNEISPVTGSIQCNREIFRHTAPAGTAGLICQTTGKPISQTNVPTTDVSGGPGWHVSPTPDGEVPINKSQGTLVDVGVIAENSAAPDTVGAFRFTCKVGAINNNDSIVYPGQPGVAHGHTNYGLSSGNDGNDTYVTLQTKAGFGTCEDMFSLEPNNRSAYWRPNLYVEVPTGSYIPEKTLTLQPGQPKIGGVMEKLTRHIWLPDHITFYYKRAPSTAPGCLPSVSPWGVAVKGCVPIPHGLKAVFGFDMAKMVDGQEPGRFRCLRDDGVQIGPYSSRIADALKDCPVGARLTGSIVAPQCWDPRYLDSPNHQDHLSHSQQRLGTGKGGCRFPKSGAKEVVIPPTLTILNSWTVTQAVVDAVKANPNWGVYLSSDEHMRKLRPLEAWAGRTEHADAFFSWVEFVRNMWTFGRIDPATGQLIKGCIEGLKNCATMNTGAGKAAKGANGAPFYKSIGTTSWGHPTNLVPDRPEGYTADW